MIVMGCAAFSVTKAITIMVGEREIKQYAASRSQNRRRVDIKPGGCAATRRKQAVRIDAKAGEPVAAKNTT